MSYPQRGNGRYPPRSDRNSMQEDPYGRPNPYSLRPLPGRRENPQREMPSSQAQGETPGRTNPYSMPPHPYGREDPCRDIARSRAPQDTPPRTSTYMDNYNQRASERAMEDMFAGFGQQDPGLSIMDRDFDRFNAPSGDVRPSVERNPDPVAPFDREPRLVPPRRPSRSITSGYRLPPQTEPERSYPQQFEPEGHLMGSPQANMLLGARPLPGGRSNTPRPRR